MKGLPTHIDKSMSHAKGSTTACASIAKRDLGNAFASATRSVDRKRAAVARTPVAIGRGSRGTQAVAEIHPEGAQVTNRLCKPAINRAAAHLMPLAADAYATDITNITLTAYGSIGAATVVDTPDNVLRAHRTCLYVGDAYGPAWGDAADARRRGAAGAARYISRSVAT